MLTKSPISINWNFTDMCNFNCLHCYSRGRPLKPELSLEEQIKIAEKIARAKVFIVNFGGGEPLLLLDHMLPVVEILHNSNTAVYVSSNGWIINEDMLIKLKRAGLNGFYISLDSLNSEIHDYIRGMQGCLNKVEKTLTLIKRYNFKVGLSTVISKGNL